MADVSFQIRAGVLHTPLLDGPFKAVLSNKISRAGLRGAETGVSEWVNLIPVITREEYNVEVTASSGCMLYSL
jgi:hypothetical protein